MYALNKVQLIGNLTKKPEIKATQSGGKVASFSLATNRTYKDKAGVKQEEVEFHNITVFGALVDVCERYLDKGMKIYAEGRLNTRSWTDQSGNKRYHTGTIAETIIILSERAKKLAESDQSQGSEVKLEDIPF